MNCVRKLLRRLKQRKKVTPDLTIINSKVADHLISSNINEASTEINFNFNSDSECLNENETVYEMYQRLNFNFEFSEYRDKLSLSKLPEYYPSGSPESKSSRIEYDKFSADYTVFRMDVFGVFKRKYLNFVQMPNGYYKMPVFLLEEDYDKFYVDFERFMKYFGEFLDEFPHRTLADLINLVEFLRHDFRVAVHKKKTLSFGDQLFFNLCAAFTVINHPLKDKSGENTCEDKRFLHGIFCSKRRRCSQLVFAYEGATLQTIVTGWFNEIELRIKVRNYRKEYDDYYEDQMAQYEAQVARNKDSKELAVKKPKEAENEYTKKAKAKGPIRIFPWHIAIQALERLNFFKYIVGTQRYFFK
jgi:hypothetical protein